MDLIKRLEQEIDFYLNHTVELAEGVEFSQHKTIQRIMKFKNRDLSGTKIDDDLSYLYHFDIISPRVDSEVKNLRIDTKHIMPYSENPRKDFAAVFIMEAKLKEWMEDTGEAEKLKMAIDEYSANGNVGFKKVEGGFERVDPLNTYITNQTAETVDDTDIIERHEMTANELRKMEKNGWEKVDEVIKNLGGQSFQSTEDTTDIQSSKDYYEIYEFTGEVSEKQFNEINDKKGGKEDEFFLAKIIVAGLRNNHKGKKVVLFSEKLKGDEMSDWYKYAHRGKYTGRFWRVGMYELLFDHQIRANEIGRQIAKGLEWASKVIFQSTDSKIMQNVRSDLVNGDIVITEGLQQVDVRLRNLDQLISDWNRLIEDADTLANTHEMIRGGSMPSGTPFRLGAMLDENASKLFTVLRQKFAVPYRRVFHEWILPNMVEDLSGKEIFRLTGDPEMIDRFRKIRVDSWYINNLVEIGPHGKEEAEAIKAEKLDELRDADPVIKNSEKIWEDVLERIKVTIVGENSDITEQMETISNLIQLEQDPERRAFLLDTIYKLKGIPIPPREEQKNQRIQRRQTQQSGEGDQRQQENGGQQGQQGQQQAMDQLRTMMGQE